MKNILNILVICLLFSSSLNKTVKVFSRNLNSSKQYSWADCLVAFNTEVLVQHNIKRALHADTPALAGKSEITDVAQKYSEYLRDNNLFKHSGNKKYGENIYSFGSSKLFVPSSDSCKKAATDAVSKWYAEIANYQYSTPSLSSPKGVVGHFTQVIWKGTEFVGCGFAFSSVKVGKFYSSYIVCNYEKPGNYNTINYLNNNVKPLK